MFCISSFDARTESRKAPGLPVLISRNKRGSREQQHQGAAGDDPRADPETRSVQEPDVGPRPLAAGAVPPVAVQFTGQKHQHQQHAQQHGQGHQADRTDGVRRN